MQQEAAAAMAVVVAGAGGDGDVSKVVEEKAVVVLGRPGCCMVHVARRLLLGQGANPTVVELADEAAALVALRPPRDKQQRAGPAADVADGGGGTAAAFPAVFIGGRLVGGVERLMAMHIAGELVPTLKQAGALWL
ncbi:hypothetical protein ACP4OV_020888 [Aristida adscensionis]